MFMMDEELLKPDELARVAAVFRQGRFIDGRASNPHNTSKVSQIADVTDPLIEEASQIVDAAIRRSDLANRFVLPNRIAAPMPCRYGVGGQYGAHTDTSLMTVAGQRIRSDVSCSVFISDPASYQGGELLVYLGSEVVAIKGKPGAAIFYPSTTLHQVNPVTAGERQVVLTFIQSYVADADQREMLYWLDEVRAREGLKMAWASRVRLGYVRENLVRMWAQG
ncbi:MAG TPA: Fe2+-dependent dioxygenase [Caulobacteraceae bacterium]|nr:Fe2+-dependent dioxygenase [Caulobacteraceae bacterium]